MSKMMQYKNLLHKMIAVCCKDGSTIRGIWSEWISELDNEPDGECIIIDRPNEGGPYGISVDEIDRIENEVQDNAKDG